MLRSIPTQILGALLLAGPLAAAAEQAEEEAAVTPYPLTVCIVSEEPLDSMGGPHVIVHEGQQVKFCCRSCVRSFNRDPAGHLARMRELAAAGPAAAGEDAAPEEADDAAEDAAGDHGHGHGHHHHHGERPSLPEGALENAADAADAEE